MSGIFRESIIFSSFRAEKRVRSLYPRLHRGLFIFSSFRAYWNVEDIIPVTPGVIHIQLFQSLLECGRYYPGYTGGYSYSAPSELRRG